MNLAFCLFIKYAYISTRIRRNLKDKVIWIIGCGHAGDFTHGQMAVAHVACARLSDSIRSGNVLKAKLRRARLGKGLLLNDFLPLSRSLEQAIAHVEATFRV